MTDDASADILVELRRVAADMRGLDDVDLMCPDMHDAAADEIEGLRARVQWLTDNLDYSSGCLNDYIDLNDKLEADKAELMAVLKEATAELRAAIESEFQGCSSFEENMQPVYRCEAVIAKHEEDR